LYTTNGRVQPPPLSIFEEDASYEIDTCFHMKIEGLVLAPKNSISLDGSYAYLSIIHGRWRAT